MNEEQMRLDMTLEIERTVADNTRKLVSFVMEQIKANDSPPAVRNRHEAYGIAAENFADLTGCSKAIKDSMGTLLSTLPDPNRPAVEAVSALCTRATEAAISAITMAAEMNRALQDLYAAERCSADSTPLDDYLAEVGDEDGFEDAAPADAE